MSYLQDSTVKTLSKVHFLDKLQYNSGNSKDWDFENPPKDPWKKVSYNNKKAKKNLGLVWEVFLKTILKNSFWKQFPITVFCVFKNKIVFANWILKNSFLLKKNVCLS